MLIICSVEWLWGTCSVFVGDFRYRYKIKAGRTHLHGLMSKLVWDWWRLVNV